MSELEEQVAEIVTDAVEKIIRLLGRDDIEVPAVASVVQEVPQLSQPAPTATSDPQPRVKGTSDPILAGFLGVDR